MNSAENNNAEASSSNTDDRRGNNNGSDSEDNFAIEEELNVLTENIVDENVKTAAQIIGALQQPDESDKPAPVPKGSDVCVLLTSTKNTGSKKSYGVG